MQRGSPHRAEGEKEMAHKKLKTEYEDFVNDVIQILRKQPDDFDWYPSIDSDEHYNKDQLIQELSKGTEVGYKFLKIGMAGTISRYANIRPLKEMADKEAIEKIAEELLVMNWHGCEANAREAWNNPDSSLDAKHIEHSVWEADAKRILNVLKEMGYENRQATLAEGLA